MDLFSIKTIKELLEKHKTTPNKTLGQNFLIKKHTLGKILSAAELLPTDTVVEVGPGIGTLTRELALLSKHVFAVEKDPAMVHILSKTIADLPSVEIICADILTLDTKHPSTTLWANKILNTPYKVVSNLPYYITSPIIRMFLEAENQPEFLVLMVQKEVAKRICAKPPDLNLLACSVQFYAEPKIMAIVPKSAFWPQPGVDSAILKITPRTTPFKIVPQLFFRVLKAGFSQPRKQLLNNLSSGLSLSREQTLSWLSSCDITPTQRAETISLSQWVLLATKTPMPKLQ